MYVFILPWQTRFIYEPRFLNGGFWEYGSASFFGSEILLWIIVILFAIDFFRKKSFSHLFGKIHYETHKKNLWLAMSVIFFIIVLVLHSVNRVVSYEYAFRILEGVCLFLVLAGSGEKNKLLHSFWLGAIVQALLGIYQFFSQAVVANKWLGLAAHKPAELGSFVVEFGDERWLRAYGAFGSPNILGGFLAAAFVLGIILYLYSSPASKIYLILGQSIILTGLVMSFSRGAWAAAIFGWVICGIYIIYTGKNKELPFFKRYHLFGPYLKQSIFYAVIFAGLFTLLSPIFFVRFNSSYRLEAKSLSDRGKQYQESFKILNKNLLLGVGPGAYTYQLYKNEPTKKVYDYQPVHNIYFLILCEWGIFGFAFWAALFGFVIREIWRRRPEYLALIFTVLLAAAFDHFWWSLPGGMALWWVIFGMLLA
jgi:O-antigen ligase